MHSARFKKNGRAALSFKGGIMKITRFLAITVLLFFLLLLPADGAFAGAPTDEMKQTVDKIIDILKNKELKKPSNEKKRRAEIRKVVSERFDFADMAKRSLGIYWRQRTPEERKEFVPLYTDLLERTYIKKIEGYTDEKIDYTGEKISDGYATVDTKVITAKNTEIPIQYRMLNENGQWMVYDVNIEGVSLINNYRNQFSSIIHQKSYEELVKKLKSKGEQSGVK
jgi:phospholipid transport system substrate-binding protein